MEQAQEHFRVFLVPFFCLFLPFCDGRWKVFHPGEEFDKIVPREGIVEESVKELIYLYDSRIIGGGNSWEVVDDG